MSVSEDIEIPLKDSPTTSAIVNAETGLRRPTAAFSRGILFCIALAWTLFQLWYASPLPFLFDFGILNDTQARSIHLAFAVFLAFSTYPSFKRSPTSYVPVQDWCIGLIGACCAAYLYLFYRDLSARPGAPLVQDIVVAAVGIAILLEATRRTLGPPLTIVALVFLTYTFLGPIMPDVIAHKGASLHKGMSHYWLNTEGVFGVALGVSTSMVFMFVLFGALLESAGAGNYFVCSTFAAMGHFKGGPAKAAVVSSALTGMISGSSTANVVTTGTFTIPMMRKAGFSAEKAGAIEVASSTNGQLMPPVMGAAAFLMIEYTGVGYLDIIRHALLPALISYIALVYMVHLEASKLGMKGLVRSRTLNLYRKMSYFFAAIFGASLLAVMTYYGLGWVKNLAGDTTPQVVSIGLILLYVALVKIACTVPELSHQDAITKLPPFFNTVKSGLYFLLPIVVLMWCLTVERLSPGLSVFWATIFQMFIVLTHRRLKGWFLDDASVVYSFRQGALDLVRGSVQGARNMVGIAVATAVAGIIVGTVTLTGIGFVMTDLVGYLAGDNLFLVLFFTAIICLVLGMGLPTTANYIVVATLMAPVIIDLSAANGLVVPLVAAHLFVFYFGVLADDTPPVGIASFAAAGISGGDPIRTGLQGFAYDIRTAILPFLFIFNTELLLIGIDGWSHLFLVVSSAVIAMLVFAAATQGFMLTRNRLWETALMLLIVLMMLRPGFIWDKIFPEFEQYPIAQLDQVVEQTEHEAQLKFLVTGENFNDGSTYNKTLVLSSGHGDTTSARLLSSGLELRDEQGRVYVDNIEFSSAAEQAGFDFDQEVTALLVKSDRPTKQYMILPALLLLVIVIGAQRRRRYAPIAATEVG